MAASKVASAPHWANLGENTFVAGIQVMFWVHRVLGRLPFLVCLYPIVFFYWATQSLARRSSLEYLQRLEAASGALGHAPGWRDTLAHFLAFADTILDKLLAVSGALDGRALRIEGEAGLQALAKEGRGAIIVMGHVGCMELCRVNAERQRGLRLNVLVHTIHAERFNRLLQRLNPDSQVHLIQVSEVNPATAMLLADKVAQGEFVAIAGDRVPVRQSMTVPADFLGESAPWPVGPYVLAALLKCPLYAMACVRNAGGEYVLQASCLAEQVTLPRRERQEAMAAYAQQFSHWLEALLAQAPLAWFNFFPFWQQGAPSPGLEQHDGTHH
ncbi:acyltransferase [Aquabacterium sp.]|uniref:LpxL/LpxP family acyltransferase n=1 Tax=Aquabacterium sp. TaxID=1872578 RepID=UPI003D6D43E5